MARRTKIYEGKAKVLYEGPEPGTIVQYFKDDATAFNAEKKDVIDGKGVLNNRLSEFFMNGLQAIGIPTHFIKRLNMREQLVRKCEIIPLEVIVRNYAAGSISKRLGIEEGTQMPRPIVEYCYKDDSLGDPLVTEEHIA
ncbi:MAG: phosphoribosylaminoimidazolesuccinocarboxamide synthase, partial [Rhodobacteraceae bacterium]|nr:phosphoribosylaminoimidazolesuccinocarboxamide synthase [Paracoccaceae bacterium]